MQTESILTKGLIMNNISTEAKSIVDSAIDFIELEELWEMELVTEAQLSFVHDLEGGMVSY